MAARPASVPRTSPTASSRRASGWIDDPETRASSPAISAANPTSNDPVWSETRPGSTANEIAGAANTHGAAGATIRRNRTCRADGTRRIVRSAGTGWRSTTVSGAPISSGIVTAITIRCGT